MKICEIFSSIEGEGIRQGYLCTFVRTVGCNLRCGDWCDSKYTFKEDSSTKEMTPDQILKECKKFKNERVTLTGGEPLLQKDALELIKKLTRSGFYVNVETNGSIDLKPFIIYRSNDIFARENLMFTVDYKCPSSNMEDKMISSNWKYANENDVIKFVVGTEQDLECLKNWVNEHKFCYNHIFVSPIFGSIEPVEIVKYLRENNLQQVRIQLQIHKLIWDKDKRGV